MKKVLFVCVENSCRSQMAEAFAKMHGKGIVEAYSSGSRPSGIVNPKAIAAMASINYDLSKHNSIGLDKIPQIEYEYAITMGCGDECPMINAVNREDWALPDPKHMESEEFNRIRDIIETEVKELIAIISQEKD
ncbi:MAG: low molecular weight phosphatase family protein [Flavobacteriales bacterium]|nr:MAG: low molecular weight phosphatase family protein [Flavobacteriales bacterium]